MLSSRRLVGSQAVLARRYAGALYDLAVSSHQVTSVSEELQSLKQLIAESSDFRFLLSSPRLSRARVGAVIAAVADVAHMSALTTNFLKLLAKNRRLTILDGAIDVFEELWGQAKGERWADVVVARPLDAAQEARLVAELGKVLGGVVRLRTRVNADLLGGFQIKVGSRQIDASLRGKLARLEKTLLIHTEAA